MKTKSVSIPAKGRSKNYKYIGGAVSSISVGGVAGGGTTPSGSSWLEEYFSYDEVNNCISVNRSFISSGNIKAHASSTPLPDSIWETMPYATATTRGGIQVIQSADTYENGIRLDPTTKKLVVDPAYGGSGVSSWNDLEDKPAWLLPTTLAAFEAAHAHTGVYEPIISKATGYAKWNGSAWSFVNETYSLSTHNHSGVYEPVFTKNTAFNKNFAGTGSATTVARSDHNHNSTYHPLGGDSATDFAVRNLNIYGEVSAINAQVVVVDDAFVQVNTGNSAVDAGLIVDNATTYGARVFWDVSESKWVFGNNGTYYPIQREITGGASTIATSNLTASRALVSDGSGKVAVSAVTATELGYLDGVTSAIQTQINSKLNAASGVAYDSYRLGTYLADAYPRKAESAIITGPWKIGNGTSAIPVTIRSSAGSRGIQLNASNDTKFGELGWNSSSFLLRGASDEILMYVHWANRYMGVGTGSPSEKLDVAGNIKSNGRFLIADTSGNIKWQIGYNSSNNDLEFYDSAGTKKAMIDTSGNLYAVGNITAHSTR